jgi:hypothetical protein
MEGERVELTPAVTAVASECWRELEKSHRGEELVEFAIEFLAKMEAKHDVGKLAQELEEKYGELNADESALISVLIQRYLKWGSF